MSSTSTVFQELFAGVMGMSDPTVWIMFAVGFLLIYLGVKKGYEPVLLFPMGLGCILANIPGHFAVMPTGGGEPGFLTVLYQAGIANELFPVLIFIGIGAMCDFAPLLRAPYMMLFAAAAHLGIFAATICAALVGFPFNEAASIGIIGAADGPTTIFVAQKFATEMLAPLTVTAFCYMSLVPIIQPPIVKLLTSKEERRIKMHYKEEKPVSQTALFLFPLMVTLVAGILAPISVPLIGALMFGNLLKVSGVCDSLAKTAQNELTNLVTLLLGITVGATMTAENILTIQVLKILCLGAVAFVFDTVGGLLFAKLANLFLTKKINPMIGACGISAFPISGRVIAKMALKEDPSNFIIQQAIGVNVAGQVASVVAGGLVMALIPVLM
ncbi:sodium ion-translocating decarboxylase subunit beta [Acidaminococcus sp. NSJ-142]|jgi:oxaloacetate decarboxylase beta subunit|uniref:sodium ion-translocating decarboxylase subunit beta n=1 Tax=Acidaminococcus TaxID=904 RepID=UPI000CF960C7|nr:MULTISPECIES: sodium ion-translocating decarboxylase subunit beta [Acidaminococcus]MCD2436106.1 sodium ion-translocating decarboxylase subunit beta [Acidaminococcus hominis]MCH4096083.1 sodium ion-translocating decarboxylase subunit beta [Acidaminococcus provencensis]RHK00918.1 sodium ion-translocating decarboxylase subunit beta [Acidaminococcus sp. AM05-11]